MPTPTQIGQDAYAIGRDRTANPYRLAGLSRSDWFAGYDAAAARDFAG